MSNSVYIPGPIKQLLAAIKMSELKALFQLLIDGSVKSLADLIKGLLEKSPGLLSLIKSLLLKLKLSLEIALLKMKAQLTDKAVDFLKDLSQKLLDGANSMVKLISDALKAPPPSLMAELKGAFFGLLLDIDINISGQMDASNPAQFDINISGSLPDLSGLIPPPPPSSTPTPPTTPSTPMPPMPPPSSIFGEHILPLLIIHHRLCFHFSQPDFDPAIGVQGSAGQDPGQSGCAQPTAGFHQHRHRCPAEGTGPESARFCMHMQMV